MKLRVHVDVGRLFTSLFLSNEDTDGIKSFKSSSTPTDLISSIFNVLQLASEHYGLDVPTFLQHTNTFTHSTMIAVNAIVEGQISRTGIITTKGFRDILTLREGGKKSPFEYQVDFPEPYIPRYLTLEVTERISAEGNVLIPLNEEEVRSIINRFKKLGVEAIAVCLLWSIRNNKHERRIGQIIEEEWPEVDYSLSYQVNPTVGEYRRMFSTALDASLKGPVKQYLAKLEQILAHQGYQQEPLLLDSTGGIKKIKEISDRPSSILSFCPVTLRMATRALSCREEDALLIVDGGEIGSDLSSIILDYLSHSRIGVLDVAAFGASESSIAWIDPGGLLQLGPQNAGTDPGPACYRRGNSQPTLIDASLALGYLNPSYFLNGQMEIDPAFSKKVIQEEVADQKGITVEEAAYSIYLIACQNMISGIREKAIEQRIDLDRALLVGGYETFGLYAGLVAQGLEVKKVLLPRATSVINTVEQDDLNIKQFSKGYFADSSQFDFEGVNKVLGQLKNEAEKFLDQLSIPLKECEYRYFTEARYPSQVWNLEVPVNADHLSPRVLEQLVENFHQLHKKFYFANEPKQKVEFIRWRLRLIFSAHNLAFPNKKEGAKKSMGANKGTRRIYLNEQFIDIPVCDAELLEIGNFLAGPAIVESSHVSILVPPGAQLTISQLGDYWLQFNDYDRRD